MITGPVFSVDLTKVESFDNLQEANDQHTDELQEYFGELAAELEVSVECATDVWYLRTRSRHTPELEAELIKLHKAGTPPNMCEFG
jgi:hypothetical protein